MPIRFMEIPTARLTTGINLLYDAIEDWAQSSRIRDHMEFLVELSTLRARNDDVDRLAVHEVIARKIDMLEAEAEGDLDAVVEAQSALDEAVRQDTYLEDVKRDILKKKPSRDASGDVLFE